ncbi:MAG: DUF429 domain-containing protein [Planctomycetota bacterium]
MPDRPLIGIDYGSKLAGTTVLVIGPGPLRFVSSKKKQDADALIESTLTGFPEADVYLDAPLSLPGVYRGLPGCDDYHRRAGDRQLGAMSPMFLGGLTARAMRLAAACPHVTWHETYPAAQAKRLGLDPARYKKSTTHLPAMTASLGLDVDPTEVTSWHHFDALLAYLAGQRHRSGTAQTYGDKAEGEIVV